MTKTISLTDSSRQTGCEYDAAAQFWGIESQEMQDLLPGIKVIKRTSDKILCSLPKYREFPPVIMKLFTNKQDFQCEVEGLTAANSLSQVSGINTPCIISILPGRKAVLMEKLRWHNISSPIRRYWLHSIRIDWGKLGTWLRQFHESKKTTIRNDNFLEQQFSRIHGQLRALDSLFTTRTKEQIISFIRIAWEYFRDNKLEWVRSHGDFGLSNLKVSGTSMFIIDFEESRMAPREFDIINFLTRMEYTQYFPLGENKYRNIQQQFLQGYGAELPATIASDFFRLLTRLTILDINFRRRQDQMTRIQDKLIHSYWQRQGYKNLSTWLENMNLTSGKVI